MGSESSCLIEGGSEKTLSTVQFNQYRIFKLALILRFERARHRKDSHSYGRHLRNIFLVGFIQAIQWVESIYATSSGSATQRKSCVFSISTTLLKDRIPGFPRKSGN
jgi:hypothetical protein